MKTTKELLLQIIKDGWFDDSHPLIEDKTFSIIDEEITNPRRDMRGTQYLLRNELDGTYGVIEVLHVPNDTDEIWSVFTCNVTTKTRFVISDNIEIIR